MNNSFLKGSAFRFREKKRQEFFVGCKFRLEIYSPLFCCNKANYSILVFFYLVWLRIFNVFTNHNECSWATWCGKQLLHWAFPSELMKREGLNLHVNFSRFRSPFGHADSAACHASSRRLDAMKNLWGLDRQTIVLWICEQNRRRIRARMYFKSFLWISIFYEL